jgi:hypothetical protein
MLPAHGGLVRRPVRTSPSGRACAARRVDQTGWRLAGPLQVRRKITIASPPDKRPQLNPQGRRVAVDARRRALPPRLDRVGAFFN